MTAWVDALPVPAPCAYMGAAHPVSKAGLLNVSTLLPSLLASLVVMDIPDAIPPTGFLCCSGFWIVLRLRDTVKMRSWNMRGGSLAVAADGSVVTLDETELDGAGFHVNVVPTRH